MKTWLLFGLCIAACADDEREKKQAECDQIAAEISAHATTKGEPTTAACNNPALPEVKPACDRLAKCNSDADKL
jgi:hypothetical protein